MARCACFTAIQTLHAFFVDWYRGEATDVSVLEEALGEAFRIITAKGNLMDRNETINSVAVGRGSDPTASIEVVDRGCIRARGLHLVTYEEHQRLSDGATTRISSAVLGEADTGWVWHLVHETWMDS